MIAYVLPFLKSCHYNSELPWLQFNFQNETSIYILIVLNGNYVSEKRNINKQPASRFLLKLKDGLICVSHSVGDRWVS